MILAFPFDNTEYGAEALGAWLSTRTRGVFSTEENLKVVANNNRTVTVKKGIAWLKMRDDWGVVFNNTEDLVLTVQGTDKTNNRMAAVICQLDKLNAKANIVIRIGEVGETPIPIRNDVYDELILAHIVLRPDYTTITSDDILDVRINEKYCGLMRDGVSQIPIGTLQEQADGLLESIKDELDMLNSGTAAMLKSVYDPTSSGVVTKAKIAEYVTWSGVAGKPKESYETFLGPIGGAYKGTFNLSGFVSAYKLFNYWTFDFVGARLYQNGTYPVSYEYGIDVNTLERMIGSSLKIPHNEIVGSFSASYGKSSDGVTDLTMTGKAIDLQYGGILVARNLGYLVPAKINSTCTGKDFISLNDDIACGRRNDIWRARICMEEA